MELAQAFVRLRVDSAQVAKDTDAGLAAGAKGKGFAAFNKAVTMAAVAGVAAAGSIGAASIKMAGDFQKGLTTLVTGAGESEKNLNLIAAGIKNIATATGTPTKALIDGLYMIESAGYHGAAGLDVLKAAAEGAKIGNADLGTVANAVTTVMTDYAMKGPGAATKATDALITVTARGKTHLEDLAGSMARVLPSAAALHVGLGDVGGAMATMTGEGTSARLAAMGLNSTLLSLAAPTTGASKAMGTLGLSSRQVSDTLTHQGLVAALNLVQQAALKAGPEGSAAYVAAMRAMLGGTNQLRVGLQLTGPHAAAFAANVAAVAAAARGAGKDVTGWALVQKDFNQQLDVLKARAEVAAITLGQRLMPVVSSLLGLFSQHAVVVLGFIAGILGLAVAAKTIIGVLNAWKIAQAVWAAVTSSSLIETMALWVMYTLGVESAGVATVIATGGIILIIAALIAGAYELYKHWDTVWSFVKRIAMDVYGWLKANWPLVAAILTGPVGIAALEIYKHWETIKGYFTDALKFITGLFSKVGDFIAAPFIAAFDKVKNAITSGFDAWWKTNGEAVKQVWNGVWTAITTVFHAFWDPTMAILRADWVVLQALFTAGSAVLRAVWTAAWDVITTAARTGWAVITAVFNAGMTVVTTLWRAGWIIVSTIFSVAWLAIQALWRTGWAAIQAVGKVAWAAIQFMLKTAWDVIVGLFTVFLQLITGHWSAAWNTVTNLATQIWNNLKALFGSTWNAIVSTLSVALGQVVTFFQGLGGRITGAVGNLLGLLVKAGNDIITGLFNGIKAVWDTVVSWFAGLPSKILSALGIHSPPQWAVDAGKHIMNGLLGSFAHGAADVKSFFVSLASDITGPLKSAWSTVSGWGKSAWHAIFGGGGGGGVAQWKGLVDQALRLLGLPADLDANVLYQMQTESGGDPNAINLSDINAQRGDPSRGLMQVIGSTFAAYHVPGTSNNIYDPLANIAAALNYARNVYGPSLANQYGGIGSGHGYAAGTSSARRGWAWVGEHGVPELVNFGGGEQVGPWAGTRGGDGAALAAIADRLDRLIDVTRQVPAGVGRHVGGAISGAGRDASLAGRYPNGGW
jgi:TP901 family phage tail tape measure protein